MAMTPDDVLKLVKDKEVKFVDFRFTDTRGKEQHVTGAGEVLHQREVRAGPRVRRFLDRRLEGHSGVRHAADAGCVVARMDPFTDEPVLNISCDVYEPMDGKPYDRDPRSIAKKAEAYLKQTGLGDTAYFGPRARVLHLRRRHLERRHVGLLGEDQVGRAPWSSGHRL
jgi:glutamine synthetase